MRAHIHTSMGIGLFFMLLTLGAEIREIECPRTPLYIHVSVHYIVLSLFQNGSLFQNLMTNDVFQE